mmetsp:Transcript_3783/g.14161  ORF Transcript_3783/g.14161 Transcript_3783/m.14161 type:complete len:254 (-) Transcript_3783:293-1054(-)
MADFASLYPLLGSSTAMYTSVYASMILPTYVLRRSTLVRGFDTSSNAGTGSADALTSSTSLSNAEPTTPSSSAGSLDIAPRSVRCPWYSAMSSRTSATPLDLRTRPASSSAIVSARDATREFRESRAADAPGNSSSAAAIALRQLSRYASFAHLAAYAGGTLSVAPTPAVPDSSRSSSAIDSAPRSHASTAGSKMESKMESHVASGSPPKTMSDRAWRSSRTSETVSATNGGGARVSGGRVGFSLSLAARVEI